MAEKRVTVQQVISWNPCAEYTATSMNKIWRRGNETVVTASASEIIAMPHHPNADKIWTVLRPELLDDSQLHEIACRFAEKALAYERVAGREPDPRSFAAIVAKRSWLAGKLDSAGLSKARQDAVDAMVKPKEFARSDARRAAFNATLDDAEKAARETSEDLISLKRMESDRETVGTEELQIIKDVLGIV